MAFVFHGTPFALPCRVDSRCATGLATAVMAERQEAVVERPTVPKGQSGTRAAPFHDRAAAVVESGSHVLHLLWRIGFRDGAVLREVRQPRGGGKRSERHGAR